MRTTGLCIHSDGAQPLCVPVGRHLSVEQQVGEKLKWSLKQHEQWIPKLHFTALV